MSRSSDFVVYSVTSPERSPMLAPTPTVALAALVSGPARPAGQNGPDQPRSAFQDVHRLRNVEHFAADLGGQDLGQTGRARLDPRLLHVAVMFDGTGNRIQISAIRAMAPRTTATETRIST